MYEIYVRYLYPDINTLCNHSDFRFASVVIEASASIMSIFSSTFTTIVTISYVSVAHIVNLVCDNVIVLFLTPIK